MALFSKVLTKIDVERRLSLTVDDGEAAFPLFSGEQPICLQVKDASGFVWSLRGRMRPGIRTKLFIDDSLKFVRSQGLKTGDEINLFRDDDRLTGIANNHLYKIEVKKNMFFECPYVNNATDENFVQLEFVK